MPRSSQVAIGRQNLHVVDSDVGTRHMLVRARKGGLELSSVGKQSCFLEFGEESKKKKVQMVRGRTYLANEGATVWLLHGRLGFRLHRTSAKDAAVRLDRAPTPEPGTANADVFSKDSKVELSASNVSPSVSKAKPSVESKEPTRPSNVWACAICTVENPDSESFCTVCLAPRPNFGGPALESTQTKTRVKTIRPPSSQAANDTTNYTKRTAPTLSPSVLDHKTHSKSKDAWSCQMCTLQNPTQSQFCSACGATRPATAGNRAAKAKEIPSSSSWQCLTCLTVGSAVSAFCKTCNAPRPTVSLTSKDAKLKAALAEAAAAEKARRRRKRHDAKVAVQRGEDSVMQRDHGIMASSVASQLQPLGCNIEGGHPRLVWMQAGAAGEDASDQQASSKPGKIGGIAPLQTDIKVEILDITRESEAYRAVAGKFEREAKGYHIVQIQALKNPLRLGAYMYKRAAFAEELGPYLNERWLWHGTSQKIVRNIAHQGFLRQFLGTATDGGWYGGGIYFAPSASTSCGYARPGEDGLRRMFLCRVLVGQYHKGYQGLKQPQAKPGDKYKQHESTVDNIENPREFVIYQDDQAYPEYLITFTSRGAAGVSF